jgi:hypothetical protein
MKFTPLALTSLACLAAVLELPANAATLPADAPSERPSAPPPQVSVPPHIHFTTLFDGKSLRGWEYDPACWTIHDGAMRGTGKFGQICTKGDYAHFRLLVTARVVAPEMNTGNGHLGVLFWGRRPTDGDWGPANALQVQPPHGAMWDYRTNQDAKPTRIIPRPDSAYHDWHTSEIVANLRTGEVLMAVDGVQLIQYRADNLDGWQKGPIGMQIHSPTSVVEYKDIKIETDPEKDELVTVK